MMGILELQGFKAQAEVLGRSTRVEWTGRSLLIDDVDLDFAKRMLDRLAVGTLAVVDPVVESSMAKPTMPATKEWTPISPPPPTPSSEVVPVPKASSAEVVTATPLVEVSAPSSVKPPVPGGYLEKLIKCSKLRDVLITMREDMGIEGEPALIAECERIKEQVPVLRTVANIKDRVGRTLAYLEGRD